MLPIFPFSLSRDAVNVQGWAKECALGCVNPSSCSFLLPREASSRNLGPTLSPISVLLSRFSSPVSNRLLAHLSLQVQHRLPVHDDVHADRARVLPPARLGGEDRPRRHGPTCFLRDAPFIAS